MCHKVILTIEYQGPDTVCHEVILTIQYQGLGMVGPGLIRCVMKSYCPYNIRGLIWLVGA